MTAALTMPTLAITPTMATPAGALATMHHARCQRRTSLVSIHNTTMMLCMSTHVHKGLHAHTQRHACIETLLWSGENCVLFWRVTLAYSKSAKTLGFTAGTARHLGEVGYVVPEDQCKWAAFASHHQADASHQVLLLGKCISERLKGLGKRLTVVWIDKEQMATVEGMREGVRLSQNFILFLTRDVLTRPFCLDEIRLALHYWKNIILVVQTDTRHGGVPGSFFEFYSPELKRAFPNADDYKWLMRNSYVPFHDRGQHADVMLHDEKSKNGILDQMELMDSDATVSIRVRVVALCP